jgi:transcriptional regulator with XRE-family HTH domain
MPRTEKPYETLRGNQISRWRVAAGFTQATAAKKLGIERKSYSNLERAATRPSLQTLHRMADMFKVERERLVREHRELELARHEEGSIMYDELSPKRRGSGRVPADQLPDDPTELRRIVARKDAALKVTRAALEHMLDQGVSGALARVASRALRESAAA